MSSYWSRWLPLPTRFSPDFSPSDEQIQVQKVLTTVNRTMTKSRIIYKHMLSFFILTISSFLPIYLKVIEPYSCLALCYWGIGRQPSCLFTWFSPMRTKSKLYRESNRCHLSLFWGLMGAWWWSRHGELKEFNLSFIVLKLFLMELASFVPTWITARSFKFWKLFFCRKDK